MLHQDSSFTLDKSPITLLTGANGSGKTQVLDALIIALGHYPKRLKKGGYETAIGVFDKEADICLYFNVDSNLLMQADMPTDIKKHIKGSNSVFIQAIIRGSGIDYYFRTKDKAHKTKRKYVRQFFKCLSIKAESKLAFTEEGTVNIFADHSSRNKLGLFLETTGLADYRENILQSMDAADKAKRSTEPLQRKLIFEREYLKKIEENRHLMRKKQELQQEYERLLIEEQWAIAKEKEREYNVVEKEHEKKSDEYGVFRSQIKLLDKEGKALQKNLNQRKQQFHKIKETVNDREAKAQILEGRNQSNSKSLEENKEKKENFASQLNEYMGNKSQQKLDTIRKRMEEIEEEREKIQKLKTYVGNDFFHQGQNANRNYLSQVIFVKEYFAQKKLDVVGPLFMEIRCKKESHRQILYRMLGFYCFAFLTVKKSEWEIEVNAFKEASVSISPMSFHHVTSKKHKMPKNSLCKEIDAPEMILNFLDNSLGLRILENSKDVKKLFVDDPKAQQIWCQEKIHYRNEGISFGWYPQVIDFCENLSVQELQKAIYAEQIETQLSAEWQQLQDDYQEADPNQKIQYAEERIAELTLDIQNIKKEIDITRDEISRTQKKLKSETERMQNLEEQINREEQDHQKISQDLAILIDKKDHAEVALEKIETYLSEKRDLLQEAQKRARQEGDCPQEVRTPDVVRQRRNLVEGKLSSLEITPISEEVYEKQVEKVNKLETEVNGASEHIKNLQSDINQRFEAWHQDVNNLLKTIFFFNEFSSF